MPPAVMVLTKLIIVSNVKMQRMDVKLLNVWKKLVPPPGWLALRKIRFTTVSVTEPVHEILAAAPSNIAPVHAFVIGLYTGTDSPWIVNDFVNVWLIQAYVPALQTMVSPLLADVCALLMVAHGVPLEPLPVVSLPGVVAWVVGAM